MDERCTRSGLEAHEGLGPSFSVNPALTLTIKVNAARRDEALVNRPLTMSNATACIPLRMRYGSDVNRKGFPMPQFVMNESDDPDFLALDEFTRGYIQAIFFTECGGSIEDGGFDPENGSQLPDEAGFLSLTRDALEAIKADCNGFQDANKELIAKAIGHTLRNGKAYDMEQAGIDFWYTRNGHGVGYWDREFPGELGDDLSHAAKKFRECYVYWTGENFEGEVHIG